MPPPSAFSARSRSGAQAGAGPRSAQRQIELAGCLEPRRPVVVLAHQRVGQQGNQRHRRGLFRHHLGQQQQHAPRRGLRQGLSRGIVGLDPPALQLGDHPGGEAAIGGDERHPLFRQFQRMADQHRDRLRFLPGVRALHQPHAGKPPLRRGQPGPAGAGLGRQEQVRDRLAALRWRGGEPGAMPQLDLAALHAHAVEQQLEVILRVRHRVVPSERRIAKLVGRTGYTERVPDVVIEREIEIGQNHRAVRQFGNHPQQVGQRRRRAGHPGGDQRMAGRRLLPPPRRMGEQLVAPLRGIDFAARAQFGQPMGLNLEERRACFLPSGAPARRQCRPPLRRAAGRVRCPRPAAGPSSARFRRRDRTGQCPYPPCRPRPCADDRRDAASGASDRLPAALRRPRPADRAARPASRRDRDRRPPPCAAAATRLRTA